MSCKIEITEEFKRQSKKIAKKHRSLSSDLRELISSLKEDPFQGDLIGENIYKIRIRIKSKGKGKSGGARVITWVDVEVSTAEQDITVYLLSIYDKADAEAINTSFVKAMIKDLKKEEE